MQTREFVEIGGRAVDLMAKAKMAIGVTLIAAGVLVAVYPQILVFLLASLTISAGLGTLLSGWRQRRRLSAVRESQPRYRVHDFFDG